MSWFSSLFSKLNQKLENSLDDSAYHWANGMAITLLNTFYRLRGEFPDIPTEELYHLAVKLGMGYSDEATDPVRSVAPLHSRHDVAKNPFENRLQRI